MTSEQSSATKSYRSGLILTKDQLEQIAMILTKMVDTIPAKFILLVENSGQIVQFQGDFGNTDTAILGSLIAADLAASQEIARLSGEYQDFQMILREGEKTHIIISEAGKSLTFLVAFRRDVPLGWARKLIQISAREIADVNNQIFENPLENENEATKGDLPDLFNDALDQIWKA